MPFDDGTFDAVWTEHVQMNIADKHAFYREIGRVTRSKGMLLFHDIFAGKGGPLHYPVPWAEESSISFLVAPGSGEENPGRPRLCHPRLGGQERAFSPVARHRHRE
jgi:SAM-dependent methyltransferase